MPMNIFTHEETTPSARVLQFIRQFAHTYRPTVPQLLTPNSQL